MVVCFYFVLRGVDLCWVIFFLVLFLITCHSLLLLLCVPSSSSLVDIDPCFCCLTCSSLRLLCVVCRFIVIILLFCYSVCIPVLAVVG